MQELIEKIENFITRRTNPEEFKMEVINGAQKELIEAYGGDDRAGVWIDAYAWRFREMIEDSTLDLVERLGNKNTHNDAIAEIKQKLYH